MSLDGYIADPQGGISWLSGENPNEHNMDGYTNFIKDIDTVILGYNTYDQIVTELSPTKWAYEGMQSYVFTSKQLDDKQEISFINGNIGGLINKLKQENGKDIWICGGAGIVNQALKDNLIDKYIITIIPTLLGGGIKLFNQDFNETKLKLADTTTYNGIVEVTYTNR